MSPQNNEINTKRKRKGIGCKMVYKDSKLMERIQYAHTITFFLENKCRITLKDT